MLSADRIRDWLSDQVPADLLEWAQTLHAQQQVSAPGLVGSRLTVAVGVQRVGFDLDPTAIVPTQWANDAFARLVPSCDCVELDPWCVHAAAAVLSIARALEVDPHSLDKVLAPSVAQVSSWMDDAFAAVAPADRVKLHKTLVFCLHPDRCGGDGSAYATLSEVWARWSSTAPR